MTEDKPITFETVRFASNEMEKGYWAAIKPMLDSLTDEEIEKIPDILSQPTVKAAAEKYGICDIIMRRKAKNKYDNIYIYCISGRIFKGETKEYTFTD